MTEEEFLLQDRIAKIQEEYRQIGYRNMRPLEWGRQTTIDEFLKGKEQ